MNRELDKKRWAVTDLVSEGLSRKGRVIPPPGFPRASWLDPQLLYLGARHFLGGQMEVVRFPDDLPEGETCSPPDDYIGGTVACAVLLERCRQIVGGIGVWHAGRMAGYNDARKGKPKSDHLDWCAVDVLFSSSADRTKALREVLLPMSKVREFGLSLGFESYRNPRKLHLGVWAPETDKKFAEYPSASRRLW